MVALGDEHILYKMPSYEDYLKSYFGVGNKMPIEISIKYILQQPSITPIPIKKFENEIAEAELNIRDRERLRTRIRLFNSLNTVQQKIQLSGRAKKRIETRRHESAVSLFRAGSQITDLLERIKYIIIHIHNYDVENDLKVLVEMILTEQPDVFIRETFVRKFFMAYSLLVEGDLSEDI
ncbi:hypothetical protein NFX39_05975 [Fructobacillus sp. W13]|uniref:Uncharacterized protein n=2 Tax=Fructobacillus apis TaxID=2935017 RepID=A0ABT0ZRK6_9LACO|nr:hypothetical protein [Fructobacillus apis]